MMKCVLVIYCFPKNSPLFITQRSRNQNEFNLDLERFIFFVCDLLRFIIKLFYLFILQIQGASANVKKEIRQRQMRDV